MALNRGRRRRKALADPRATTPDAAERMVASARPFYCFNAGLHSSESGSPEMVMELACRLARSEQPFIRAIRANIVVLINPVSEPDGRDRFVGCFCRNLKGGTDGDGTMVVGGGAKGERTLEGRQAILDFPVAKGHVIAYNFNPMHRDLNRSDDRLFWNALLNWQAILR